MEEVDKKCLHNNVNVYNYSASMCVALCFQGDGRANELPADQRTADKDRLTAAQEGEEMNIHTQETSPPMLCTILGSH